MGRIDHHFQMGRLDGWDSFDRRHSCDLIEFHLSWIIPYVLPLISLILVTLIDLNHAIICLMLKCTGLENNCLNLNWIASMCA